jgi:hypothetical protein
MRLRRASSPGCLDRDHLLTLPRAGPEPCAGLTLRIGPVGRAAKREAAPSSARRLGGRAGGVADIAQGRSRGFQEHGERARNEPPLGSANHRGLPTAALGDPQSRMPARYGAHVVRSGRSEITQRQARRQRKKGEQGSLPSVSSTARRTTSAPTPSPPLPDPEGATAIRERLRLSPPS